MFLVTELHTQRMDMYASDFQVLPTTVIPRSVLYLEPSSTLPAVSMSRDVPSNEILFLAAICIASHCIVYITSILMRISNGATIAAEICF